MLVERRQHPRLVPNSPTFVSLGHAISGLLLNAGEGGIALASLLARNLDDVISVTFELPDGRGSIQAEAEIAWIRDEGHLSGARFVNVDEHSLRQLGDWISGAPKTVHPPGEAAELSEAKQLVLPVEEESAEVISEEVAEFSADLSTDATPEVRVVDESVLEGSGQSQEVAEVSESPKPPAECSSDQDIEVTSASVENSATQDSFVAHELPPHYSLDRSSSVQGAATNDAPNFVTRSSYPYVDPGMRASAHEAALSAADASWQLSQEARGIEQHVLSELGLTQEPVKGRHTIELILAVIVLSWALVFLGYQMGRGVSRKGAGGSAATAAAIETPASTDKTKHSASSGLLPSVQASPAPPREAALSATPLGDAGVVLQVGAMKIEDHADTLAQDLQKKNLPAFVFRHGQDGLYHVAVGPFSDDETTAKIKAKLEKQGLQPIVRRWLPE